MGSCQQWPWPPEGMGPTPGLSSRYDESTKQPRYVSSPTSSAEKLISKCQTVKSNHQNHCRNKSFCVHLSYSQMTVFQLRRPWHTRLHHTWAGVSVSLIGCPSNRNRICLIDKPWGKGRTCIRCSQTTQMNLKISRTSNNMSICICTQPS